MAHLSSGMVFANWTCFADGDDSNQQHSCDEYQLHLTVPICQIKNSNFSTSTKPTRLYYLASNSPCQKAMWLCDVDLNPWNTSRLNCLDPSLYFAYGDYTKLTRFCNFCYTLFRSQNHLINQTSLEIILDKIT